MRLVEFVKGKTGPKGEPLSDRTARYAVDVLFRMIGSKMKAKIMEDDTLELPSASSVRSRRLSADELAEVLTEIFRTTHASEKRVKGELVREARTYYVYRNRYLIAFLINTGLRINEALGLTLDRIDLTPGRERVIIDRQLKWKFDADGHRIGWHLSDLKTDKSQRTLPLNADAIMAIKGMTAMIEEDARLAQSAYQANGLLFASEHGTPTDNRGVFRTLQLATKAINKRRQMIDGDATKELQACGLHDLRRSYLTQMAMIEPRMAVVAYLAGHVSPATTAKHYVFAEADNAIESVAKVGFRARVADPA
ncbi:hypothetical protein EON81_21305 [bacterium]|nr:MAG: hypothetical protein EON81_21305 [bacterium]